MEKQVYLIRHGIAINRALSEEDATRPLTEKGRKKWVKFTKPNTNSKKLNFWSRLC